MPTHRKELGIPENAIVESVAFHPVADALILSMRVPANGLAPERLYYRHTGSSAYREVPYSGDPSISYSSVVLASSEPKIFFNSFVSRGNGFFDWQSILCFDLTTECVLEIASADTLGKSEAGQRRFVASLLAVDAAGTKLYCNVGTAEATPRRIDIRYALCELTVANLMLVERTPLPGISF